MKSFIYRTLFFIIIILLSLSLELIFPVNKFTFRPWEALSFYNPILGHGRPFYPNTSLTMFSVGDLKHNTPYEVKREEKWKTDKLGFRNNTYIYSPEILFIGDSFIAGSGVSQDSTITNLMNDKLGNKFLVYNMAPANFNDFLRLRNRNLIGKPKIIIFSKLESFIYQLPHHQINFNIVNRSNNYLTNFFDSIILSDNHFFTFLDRFSRMYSLNYLAQNLGFIKNVNPRGINNKNMFYPSIPENNSTRVENISSIIESINGYKKYCDSVGIKFLFLPIPNKNTIYYNDYGYRKQPDFLLKLLKEANNHNLQFINVQEIFSVYTKLNPNNYLYQFDDTHWNSNGINLLVDSIIKKIELAR